MANSPGAKASDVLDAIYALRREKFRQPEKVRISEGLLRRFAAEAGMELPTDEDGEPLPLQEPLTLWGVRVELDESLDGFVVV